ncbi:Co-activator of prophage gene expression IbrA [Candidatus Burkholderia verschuerenii]|uniref:Co-activator of prophage gene expression IbrA n=1 Tax=Candidatus Burkholderia verschuerenii TaxID=242163 RepID=A0A0L0MB43_9BURK|nr:DUF3440 domain-containing protein [Candidatus Burkholderia verschuerenii]KND59490.1 Co-activator of prophage gene expression IbrA [Candidatus Burkholderia verschuerenii]
MEFEEFVAGFDAWLARDVPTAFLVGIRADESLNRYRAIRPRRPGKRRAWTPPGRAAPIAWSSRHDSEDQAVSFFPIYDWKFGDLWRYTHEKHHAYNRLYDDMHWAGIAFSQMRICQPYGDDQRKGLDLFHRIEPETWFRVVTRVAGANYAARYCRQRFLGYRGGTGLPSSFATWKAYAHFQLGSMPEGQRVAMHVASNALSNGGRAMAIRSTPGPTQAHPRWRIDARNHPGAVWPCHF